MNRIVAKLRASGGASGTSHPLIPLLRRFAVGAFWSVLGSMAARALPILSALFVAGLLGSEGYGQLGVIQNTLNLFVVLSGLGLGLTATRFVAANRTTHPALAGLYARLAMRITVVAGFGLAAVTFFTAPVVAREAFGQEALSLPLQLAAPIVIFAAINSAQMGILSGLEAWRPLALAGVAQGVITAALLVGGAVFGGVTGAVLGLAIGEAVSAGILRLTVVRVSRTAGIDRPMSASREHWRKLLRFGIPALVSSSLTMPATMIGTILLTRQPDGLTEMGLFTAASRWSFAVLFLPTAVSRIVMPMLANFDGAGNRADFRRMFLVNTGVSLGFVAVPAAVMIALAGPMMGLLGPEYRAGSMVLVILLLATLPITLNDTVGQVLTSTGAIGWRLALDIVLSVLLVVTAVVFIPRSGASGLALSQLVSFGVVAVLLAGVVAIRLRGQGRTADPEPVAPTAAPGAATTPSTTVAPGAAPAQSTTVVATPRRIPGPAWRDRVALPMSDLALPVATGGGFAVPRGTADGWQPRVERPVAAPILDRGVFGCMALAWIGVLWFITSLPDPRFLAVLVPVLGVPAVLFLLPACRPSLRTPLSPHNWVLFIFLLQALILPLSINSGGVSIGQLPWLPSTEGFNRAILLSFVAFVAYCVTFQWANRATGAQRTYPDRPRPERRPPHLPLALFCGALGIVGFVLQFGGPGGLIAYYLAPEEGALGPSAESATLAEAASTFLRPFLGFAIVFGWALWADRRAPSASRRQLVLVTVAAAVALLIVYASFGYNRGAFTAPLIALVAAYSLRVRRIPWKAMLVGGLAGLIVLVFWGGYRTSEYGSLGDIISNAETRATVMEDLELESTLQIYGGAPQLTAFVLDSEATIPPEQLGGQSLLGSVFAPIPIIGEAFRSSSGVEIFNRLIYGPYPEFYDQVMPFQAELYINFGLTGIIIAYASLGLIVARLERSFQTTASTAQAFIAQYAAVWLGFLIPGSLAATSQIFIYFFWPAYLYLALRLIGWRSERNAPRPIASAPTGIEGLRA
ncbi:MAG TPA: oligosaccharide flippase family protein [Thermomicrobiales bacterium]|jgi:oligosaccharide repeat unit polymerase|nr:oligosaccharide flippase family protein [Thermomicrobiales bacterium]